MSVWILAFLKSEYLCIRKQRKFQNLNIFASGNRGSCQSCQTHFLLPKTVTKTYQVVKVVKLIFIMNTKCQLLFNPEGIKIKSIQLFFRVLHFANKKCTIFTIFFLSYGKYQAFDYFWNEKFVLFWLYS